MRRARRTTCFIVAILSGGGFSALAAVASPVVTLAQTKPLSKVRYNEVVRSLLYAPYYVASTNGYFKDAGLDIELATGNGGDKTMAALLSGSADIALAGPETTIYVINSDSSTKARIFCSLTATDGFMLVGRTKPDGGDHPRCRLVADVSRDRGAGKSGDAPPLSALLHSSLS
jgi:ABC-type nitrate/sulfonate/bicarbonate transport system substrate-binding protein